MTSRSRYGYHLPISGYMREAFARRARLVPALHTANHGALTSGVASLRPLYYDHADLPGAYRHKDTYLFW